MDPQQTCHTCNGRVAATAVAAAGTSLLAQQVAKEAEKEGAAMGVFEKGTVRIHFEEAGSGFPLLAHV